MWAAELLEPGRAEELAGFLRQRFAGTFFEALGIRIVSTEPRRVVGEMTVSPSMLNPSGQLHGGAMTSLADSMAGLGASLTLPEGAKGFGTIEMKMNILRSVGAGRTLRCRATPVHLGRTTQVWDAEVEDVERPGAALGLFRCTQMIMS